MSHQVLIKHGWELVFETDRFRAYQLDNKMIVVWGNNCKAYEVNNE